MTEMPYVQLNTGGPISAFPERTTEQAIISGLLFTREAVIRDAREQLRTMRSVDAHAFSLLLDVAFRRNMPSLRKILHPYITNSYLVAYREVGAEVEDSIINALTTQYTDRLGEYFNATSAEAAIQGFNTFVNRKLPQRAAAERALDALGLTPRQMNGYTSSKFDSPVDSPMSLDVKRRAKSYIGTSIKQRLSIFATQETHNLDEQAQQMAWLWMVSNNRLTDEAEKVWLTARDERVCPSCGPMHGKRVKVREKFVTPLGEIWTPGLHVNCRCTVRLVDIGLLKEAFGKADNWYDDEFKRTSDGRFARARAKTLVREPKNHITYSAVSRTRPEEMVSLETPVSLETGISLDVATSSPVVNLAEVSLETPVETQATTEAPVSLETPVSTEALSLVDAVALVETVSLAGVDLDFSMGKVDMKTDVVAGVEQTVAVSAPVKTETKTKTYKPIYDILPLTRPYYTVVEGTDYHYQFDEGQVFDENEVEAVTKAAQLKNEKMGEKFEELTDHGNWTFPGSRPTPVPGFDGNKIIHMTDRDLWQVVRAVAYRETFHDDDDIARNMGDNHIPVAIYQTRQDQTGNGLQGEEYVDDVTMSVNDIARAFDIKDDDFAVRVLKLGEVHGSMSDGEIGGGQVSAGGNYSTHEEQHAAATVEGGQAVYVRMLSIEPDSPDIVYDDAEDEDYGELGGVEWPLE